MRLSAGRLAPQPALNQPLKTLAGMDNVSCKLSGLVVEADWDHWTEADLKPYIDTVIECFGFERLVFGGDWPVVLQAAQWQQWKSQQRLTGPNAVPDYANPAQLNHLTWYETHGWTTPYPGESKIYAPDQVPGADLPSSESDG